jgi:hypothetical protein
MPRNAVPGHDADPEMSAARHPYGLTGNNHRMVSSNQPPLRGLAARVMPGLREYGEWRGHPSEVRGDVAVVVSDAFQAAVVAGSMGVRVTFMPGLSRSISRILDRVWRAGLRGVL